MNEADQALVRLGRWLGGQRYGFTTITPESHARVNARPGSERATSLRDIFGWSRPFHRETLPAEPFELLESSGQLAREGALFRSRVRFSSLGDGLFVHSAYPTTERDAVFFGPDTYRYARMLQGLPRRFARAIEVGAGSGAGLLSIARRCDSLQLTDINELALRFTRVNAELNRCAVSVIRTDVLAGINGEFDLIASNPPYLVDEGERSYRHGGHRGVELPARIVREALPLLSRSGTLAIYTGAPIVDGRDLFHEAVQPLLAGFEGSVEYEELDPDVFGEELERPAYADVERIAVVSLRATRSSV